MCITHVLYPKLFIISSILFKVLILNFKGKNGIGPKYLSDLLVSYDSGHLLRSEASGLLRVPRTKQVTYEGQAFSKAAPTLWNSMPTQIRKSTYLRSFKNQLKTCLKILH